MLSEFMITRHSARFPCLVAAAYVLVATPGCEQVPLLAPSGSTIILTASTNGLPTNATTDIIAQVLEASGTPPHSGTLITFTTTLGSIEPAEARTDVGGRVVVRFLTGAANGTAVITATSGGATTGTNGAIRIAIGTAAVGRVTVNATPATVPAIGGSTTVVASVFDINGNSLRSTPVSFTTTAGTLSSSVVDADANGTASTTLTTSQQAIVTASVGAQAPTTGTGGTGTGGTGTGTGTGTSASGQASGSVTVNVAGAPTLLITPPSSPPSEGLPAIFTFVVTAAAQNGSAIRQVTVNWGDGESQNLGSFTGSQSIAHVFDNDGTFVVSGTVTDVAGNANTVSTSVVVIPVARPTIIVTPTPQSAPGGSTIFFQIDIRAAAGISIQNVTINFGDGRTQSLGGFTGIVTVPHQYAAGVQTYTVIVTVTDSTGQTTNGSTTVSITT